MPVGEVSNMENKVVFDRWNQNLKFKIKMFLALIFSFVIIFYILVKNATK